MSKVLIDECLDWRLGRELSGCEVSSVARMGWAGIKNGRLLAMAEAHFDVFITGDRNLQFQQEIGQLRLAVVVLRAPSTRLRDTAPLMVKVQSLLPNLPPGSVTEVSP